MIILGIDPGTTTIGYAVLKKTGQDLELIKADAIKTVPKSPQDEKLTAISDNLSEIIDIHRPDVLALEKLFFFKNNKTVIAVAEARGAILLTAKRQGVRLFEYTPLEVKMAVTGYGRAEKSQVHSMVKAILGLKTVPKLDDITDAIAIAICCANSLKNI